MGFINQIGPLGWPLTLIAVSVMSLFTSGAFNLYGKKSTARVDLELIRILGNIGLSLGAFSTLLGIYQGLQIFAHLSSEQVAAGFSQALLAFLYGLFIFITASAFRFILQLRVNRLENFSD